MSNERELFDIEFGDFCTIEQKRYGCQNEFYRYKVVGRKRSNSWTEAPVDGRNEKEVLHDHIDDVVTVVCDNLDDRTVHQFRISDLSNVIKTSAQREGFVLVPVKATEKIIRSGYEAHDGFICMGQVRNVWDAMIEEGAVK